MGVVQFQNLDNIALLFSSDIQLKGKFVGQVSSFLPKS